MASITRRRNGDGSTSWDALVRVVGFGDVQVIPNETSGRALVSSHRNLLPERP